MDVVTKEGQLFLQGVKFGKKIWRKTWLALFEPSPAGIGRMELYDIRDGRGLKGFTSGKPAGFRKTDRRVIRLTDCLSITPAPGESCPKECSAFFLNTTTCTFTIAAPTQEDWISVLCKLAFQKTNGTEDARKAQRDKYMPLADNDLYSTWGAGQFQVTVQSTDASQRCRMSGSYLLSSEKEAVCLLDLKTGQAIFRWPYRLLRRFGKVKGGIMIEAGCRCQTGEGQFIFMSKQGSQIHKAIEEAIMHQSVQELLAQATVLPEFASQPSLPKTKTQDRPTLPPIYMNQERPRPMIQHKQGQQIYKTIGEALIQHSVQELPAPSTTLQKDSLPPPPPPSPKPKPMDRSKDKPKVNKHPPVNMNQCRPVLQQKPGQPMHRAIEEALMNLNVQELMTSSNPLSQAPTPPPSLPKSKPKNRPYVNKHPLNLERPLPELPHRNISLPEPPCAKSPVRSPDNALYSSVGPQPKPRAKTNLPKVPMPPRLPAHVQIHIKQDAHEITNKEKAWNSSQDPLESKNEDTPYINRTATTTAEQDQLNIEALYSRVNFAGKHKNRQIEDNDGQEQPNTDQQTPVTTSTEIPVDFKQTLSSYPFKELSKIPPPFPFRSHRGSIDHLESLED
ncbi:docking protein 2-like [Xyrauchen texanus]|uniref:docking protein 2-like n=1 Tax=Xyrauchen texanus TaxID=154827 RepID=UPI002242083C|nr:docking protein 2-like [Xyrauchen texanus]